VVLDPEISVPSPEQIKSKRDEFLHILKRLVKQDGPDLDMSDLVE
jgi:hypothetical protein